MNIRLLGPPEIVKADGTAPVFTTAKSAGLFYYLVTTQQSHSRSALAQLFWSDFTDQNARVNLNKALTDLRRQFADHFEITTQAVYFRIQVPYRLDIDDFQKPEPTGVSQATAGALQKKTQLYRGEFLHGFIVRNAPEFELWMVNERERLRGVALECFAGLASLHQATGETDAALAGWRTVLTLERWHERAHCAIMTLLVQTGHLHAALKQYEACCAALADELEVGPSAETVALYHSIRADQRAAESGERPAAAGSDATLVGKAALSPTLAGPYPSNLIGRQTAWQQLDRAWQQAQTQGTHCVLVCGETGIGKSYLADAFVTSLESTDALILRSRYYLHDEYSTFSPIYDWMKEPRLQEAIQRLPNFVQQDIARFHPGLLEQNPQLTPPEPAILPYQKRRLFDSILAALDGLQRPIVLYIDDLHWMDHETATWLHHALHPEPRPNPLLIIGTIRNESLSSSSAWSQWIQTRQHDQLLSQIQLKRLDLADTTSLLKITGYSELNATVATSIHEISEGNPLFIIELVRAGWPHGTGNGIPTQIEGMIQQRLRLIAAELRELLQWAAVVGRDFDYRLLLMAMSLPEAQIVQQLEELCRLEIIQALSETVYRFSHGLFQEVIYGALSAPRRHLFHQQVAQVLINTDSDATKDASIIGKHFEEAFCWQEAITYYIRAGDADFQIAAFETAEIHYQAAQRLTRQLQNRGDIQRLLAQLLLKRGAIHSMTEASPQQKTVALYTEAHRLYTLAQDDRSVWMALRGLWETRLNCNQIVMAKELTDQMVQIGQTLGAMELLFEAYWTAGNTAFYQGRFVEANAIFEQAITLRRDHGPFPPIISAVFSTDLAVWLYQAFIALLQGNITKSRALLRDAGIIVAQGAKVADRIYYETHRLIYAHFVRDLDYGMAEMDRVLQTARQLDVRMSITACSIFHFSFSSLLGTLKKDDRGLEALLIQGKESTLGASHFLALCAQVYIAQKNFTRAQEVIALCAENVDRCGDAFMITCLYHAEAQLLRATGCAAEEIHAAYVHAMTAAQAQMVPYLELQIALDYAGYLVEVGQRTVARDLLQGVLAQVEGVADDYYVRASLRLLDEIHVS